MTNHASASSFSDGIYPAESELKMPMPNVRDEIFTHVRPLRAYAMMLVGDRAKADDLAEEALRKAWEDFASFQRGGNLRAWLFTILRGASTAQARDIPARTVGDQGTFSGGLTQELHAGPRDLAKFRRAFAVLPDVERETLHLVGAEGFSHETAAVICGCAVSTIDSRATRGRQRLAQLLASSSTPSAEADDGRKNTRQDTVALQTPLPV